MSGVETIALVLVAVWLGVLSLAVGAMVRQVGLLTLRLDRNDSGHSLDGISVGSALPEAVTAALPRPDLSHVLVLGAECSPCRQLVDDLRGSTFGAPVLVIVEGDEERAAAVAEDLPADAVALTGARAAEAYAGLDLQTTPFMFAVDGGTVVDKMVVRGAAHLRTLIDPRPSAEGDRATPVLEVSHVR